MENLFKLGVMISTGITGSLVFIILAFLLYFAFPLFESDLFLNFFTWVWDEKTGHYGLLPMVLGTAYISLLATVFATLMAFSLASLIESFLPKKMAFYLEGLLVLLCGVPTVVYAFGALFLVVPSINYYIAESKGLSILSASFVLSFVVLPTMSLMFLNAFRALPKQYKKAGLSLGISSQELFFYMVVPYAKRDILSAIIFGFSRAVGDTLIALMLAGNALAIPHSLLDSARTLTAHIALVNANDYESIAFKAIFLSALLLFVFTCSMVLAIRLIKKKEIHG